MIASKTRRWAVALLLLAAAPFAARAQSAFPSKPINLIISLQAGSGSDVAGRLLAEKLSAKFGVAVIVENQPGAGGIVGAVKLMNAAPDGYTIGALNNGLMTLVPNLPEKMPLDPKTAFVPVGMLAELDSAMVIPNAFPARNLREFVAYSKSHPGQLSYGSTGLGSPQHIAMEMLKASTGANLLHVPYKGGPQSVADAVAGRIQAVWNAIPVLQGFIKSGQLRALVVGGAARSPLLPDVPTLAEAGVTDFTYVPWVGIYAPAGTPTPIISTLNSAMQEILKDPQNRARLLALGLETAPSSSDQLGARGNNERAQMANIVPKLVPN
jgi:tripartite-type tricarboxylate transporter receptor subunit TctC